MQRMQRATRRTEVVAYVSKHAVRHIWSCENCDHDIEMTVNPRINAASKLRQGIEWSVVG
jgi:hypothetical protein